MATLKIWRNQQRRAVVRAVVAMLVIGGLAVGFPPAANAQNATIVVNSNGDQPDSNPADGQCQTAVGTCTLRAAIEHGNYEWGSDTIHFAIPGGGVKTINVGSTFPEINSVNGTLTIDGYTQPGATPNTAATGSNAQIKIQLEGKNNGPMFQIRSEGNEFRGLAAYKANYIFYLDGTGANGNRIVGNFIGTNAAGTFSNSGGHGVQMMLGASQNMIGTKALADRNVISGNGTRGLRIDHDDTGQNLVQNNVIGLKPNLSGKLSQWSGIDIQWSTYGNMIGGFEPGQGNLISGHNYMAIDLSHGTKRNFIVGNYIGTKADGNSVASFTRNVYAIGLKDFPHENYIANNVMGGNKWSIWGRHNYTADNIYVNNRVGVGINGGSIPNERAILHTGVGDVWHSNIVAENDGLITLTNDDGTNDFFSYPSYTHRNRITQGQYYQHGAGGGAASTTNVAVGKPTSQSSTAYNGASARAVDGNTNGTYNNGSVTHTSNQSQPWWQVDLGTSTAIDELKLFNRTDCCTGRLANFHVLVSDSPFGNSSLNDLLANNSIWRQNVSSLNGSSIAVPVNQSGRYVRVQLNGNGVLSLAEVQALTTTGGAGLMSQLPIDIAPNGLNANDPGDGDNGIQDLLNWPEISGIGPGKVFGTACDWCQVEVYVSGTLASDGQIDTSGSATGKGLAWIGTAQANASGVWSLGDNRIAAGRALSALAIDGQGNTSELPIGQIVPASHSGTNGNANGAITPFAVPATPPMPTPYVYNGPDGPPPPPPPPATSGISGSVTNPAGAGLSGMNIDLFNEDRTTWLEATTTAQDGSYQFDVNPGCYTLTFVAQGADQFISGTYLNESVCVQDGTPGTVNAQILGAGGTTTVGGTVANRVGAAVGNVSASLYTSDQGQARIGYLRDETSDANGAFQFDVGPGCYVVTLTAPAGETFVESQTAWLNLHTCVTNGQNGTLDAATVDTGGAPDPAVGGIITNGAGQPVGNVLVDLFAANADGSRGSWLKSDQSAANGSFDISMPIGCYILTYSAPNGSSWAQTGTQWWNRPVCVSAGETNNTLDAQLS